MPQLSVLKNILHLKPIYIAVRDPSVIGSRQDDHGKMKYGDTRTYLILTDYKVPEKLLAVKTATLLE